MKNKDELINQVFFKKYKILKKIGKGSFGLVYLAKIIDSHKYVAAKFEPKNQSDLILERECYFLYFLKGFGIPEVITFGHNLKYNILIQTLLGNSLNDIFLKNKKMFSMKDCCMLGIQMIDRIEHIHSKYVVHRDIKPDNFLVGNPDKSLIYLIDFGLAKKYMSGRTGKHVKFIINKIWSGTTRFASANSLRGVVQSRRDDLESLCYILLFFMKGSLPWDNIHGNSENDDTLLIYKIKKYMKPELLFFNLPQETIDFFKYCKKLDFEQKPDYNYLRSLLLKILNFRNEKNDLNFSWINKNGNNLMNNKKELLNNRYKRNNKRKASPQINLYNSLLNNRMNEAKRSESFNKFCSEKGVNKVKRDCQAIKNISPSPNPINSINNLYNQDRKEKSEPNKKKIPKIKKIIIYKVININKNNSSKNEILKSQISQTQNVNEKVEKDNKNLNSNIPQNFTKKIVKYNSIKINNDSYENEKNKIILNSTYSYFNNINKTLLTKNNSYNNIVKKGIFPIRFSPNKKKYKRLFTNDNNININNDININKKNYYYKKINGYNYLDNLSYNQKINNKKNLVLNKSFLNTIQNNSNTNIFNTNNNKISIDNSISNITDINKIKVPKKIRYNHILAMKDNNKLRIKNNEYKRKYNFFKSNKNNNTKYNTNQSRLNTDRNNKSSFININNENNYLNIKNINFKPNDKIKIINIICPVNQSTTDYKTKDNSCSPKLNLNKYKSIKQNNNKGNKIIINNKNKLLYDYYSNVSSLENNQQEGLFLNNNTYTSNINSYETSFNEKKNIIKKNNSFIPMKLKNNKRTNFSKIKLKIDLYNNSLKYGSPQLIYKMKKYF